MKKVRVIARLDIKGPNVVKGIQFECLRVMGKPQELAEEYYLQGADELLYLDTVANLYRRDNLINIVHKASEKIFIPFTVGGGIRTIDDIRDLLLAGAEKVAINTAAVQNPELITEAAKIFGSQCVVISIEAKKRFDGTWEPYVDSGRQSTGLNAVDWAKKIEALGAGEIIITSVDREGTEQGLDIDLIKAVSEAVSIPVIAAGGAASLEDFSKCTKETHADAIATASLLHYRKYGIAEIKEHLHKQGIPVRLLEDAKKVETDPNQKYDLDNYNKYTTAQIEEEYVDVSVRKEEREEDLTYGSCEEWEIGVIDCGINNVKSVVKSFEKLGKKARRITTPKEVLASPALVLPGVGAFQKGMEALRKGGFIEPLQQKVSEGIPLLGICLGMQLLFTESEEFGLHKGLNFIPGRVVPLKPPAEVQMKSYSVPHIGWNSLQAPVDIVDSASFVASTSPTVKEAKKEAKWTENLLKNLPERSNVYFVHSYYPETEQQYVVATTTYGSQKFPSVVQNGNVFATQFHPEKSGEIGVRILQSFCEQIKPEEV